MKKLFYIVAVGLLSGCSDQVTVVKTGLEGKTMPSFELLLPDSLHFINTASIAKGKPAVLFAFSPHCPYCRAQTEDIISHIDKLKGLNVYLITTPPFSDFKKFCQHYDLGKYDNIVAGVDTSNYVYGYYQSHVVPILAIYDSNKKLKQVLQGKTSVNLIKDIALEQ